jgi:hypothetical protein
MLPKIEEPLPQEEEEKDATKDKILRLYELEYKTGVKRHDDIYKSMWTNFSYMAILAGGILTFGKDRVPVEWIAILACLPLLFWFWASFLPLDRYGNLVAKRITEIERVLNKSYFEKIVDASLLENNNDETKLRNGLFLYTDFERRKQVNKENIFVRLLKLVRNPRENIRVIHSISFFSFILHVFFFGLLLSNAFNYFRPSHQPIQIETTEKRLESINNTLQNIGNSMDGLRNSYEGYVQKGNNFNVNANVNIQNQTNGSPK